MNLCFFRKILLVQLNSQYFFYFCRQVVFSIIGSWIIFKTMKKIWVYIISIGVLLILFVPFIINKATQSNYSSLSFFDEPGEVLTVERDGRTLTLQSFKVYQVIGDGTALAHGDESFSQDITVLIWDDKGTSFYEEQTVTAPEGKCFKQVGTYGYVTTEKKEKTVPIVALSDCDIEESISQ